MEIKLTILLFEFHLFLKKMFLILPMRMEKQDRNFQNFKKGVNYQNPHFEQMFFERKSKTFHTMINSELLLSTELVVLDLDHYLMNLD